MSLRLRTAAACMHVITLGSLCLDMPPVVPASSSSDTGNRTVTLSNGVEMPTVGFGCAGYVRKPALLEALAAGYRLFDTAQATEWYLEDELGAALAEAPHVNRSELFLTSKLHPRDLGEQPTLDAFPRSLARLRTTYLDAFLLHYPACFGSLCATPPAGTWRESWRALEALYDQGRIRALGVSNFAPSQLRELLQEEAGKSTMLEEERDALSKRVGAMQDQVRQLTMDAKGMNAAEFEDTFEAVMREEFDAMRNAYEGKLKALQADASKQRNAHDKSVRDVQKELRSKMVTLRTDVMRRDATIAQMRKEIEDLKKLK